MVDKKLQLRYLNCWHSIWARIIHDRFAKKRCLLCSPFCINVNYLFCCCMFRSSVASTLGDGSDVDAIKERKNELRDELELEQMKLDEQTITSTDRDMVADNLALQLLESKIHITRREEQLADVKAKSEKLREESRLILLLCDGKPESWTDASPTDRGILMKANQRRFQDIVKASAEVSDEKFAERTALLCDVEALYSQAVQHQLVAKEKVEKMDVSIKHSRARTQQTKNRLVSLDKEILSVRSQLDSGGIALEAMNEKFLGSVNSAAVKVFSMLILMLLKPISLCYIIDSI